MKNWDSKKTKRIREFPLVLFVSEKENALLVTGTVNSNILSFESYSAIAFPVYN